MTEAFLNTPLGQQEVGLNGYLRQKDPDAMMLNLGMALSDAGATSSSAAMLSSGADKSGQLLQGGEPPFIGDGGVSIAAGEGGSPAAKNDWFERGTGGVIPRSGNTGGTKDFNFLVRALAAHGRGLEARSRVVLEMRRRGVALDGHTYSALIAGAAVERNASAADEVSRG